MLQLSPVTVPVVVCRMYCGPHPVHYGWCEPCQSCLSLPCVAIWIIWNTNVCNMSYQNTKCSCLKCCNHHQWPYLFLVGIAWILIRTSNCVRGVFPCYLSLLQCYWLSRPVEISQSLLPPLSASKYTPICCNTARTLSWSLRLFPHSRTQVIFLMQRKL